MTSTSAEYRRPAPRLSLVLRPPRTLASLLFAVVFTAACAGSSGGGGGCPVGTLGCGCNMGGCEPGLECQDGVCVEAAICGNGLLEPGEDCDDGNGVNTDACLDSCENASCGDGFVFAGVEECDDGDEDDTDECLHDCQAARCGDGQVHLGVEECDDANADDLDDCLGTCEFTCEGGTPSCGGICPDLQTDSENCGECGNVCSECQECRAGACAGGAILTSGPRSPRRGENLALIGTRAWDSPGNVTAEDGGGDAFGREGAAYVSAMVNWEISNYLVARDFGFTLPDDATVRGIVVEIRRAALSGVGVGDYEVRTILGDDLGSDNKAEDGNWDDFYEYRSYGDETDRWGEVWTGAEINDPGFGAVLATEYRSHAGNDWPIVDHVRITVHYQCP